jgi:protein SCO1/2
MTRAFWLGTVALTTATLILAFAGAAHFTANFRAWTSEDARRLRVVDAPPRLSALVGVSASGEAISLWPFGERYSPVYLLVFMYTRCPSGCRIAGEEFEALQRELRRGEDERIRLLSISFDPAFDTPERLRDYSTRHRADPAYWMLITPRSSEALSALLRTAGVVVIDDGLGGYAHNAAIHVVGDDGRLMRIFDIADYAAALAYARGLAERE